MPPDLVQTGAFIVQVGFSIWVAYYMLTSMNSTLQAIVKTEQAEMAVLERIADVLEKPRA